jgi:hypothetical protein
MNPLQFFRIAPVRLLTSHLCSIGMATAVSLSFFHSSEVMALSVGANVSLRGLETHCTVWESVTLADQGSSTVCFDVGLGS